MVTPTVNDNEIEEIIDFLKKKGRNDLANRVDNLRYIEAVGRQQYQAGLKAIFEVENALTEKVPRDLILQKIYEIIQNIKKVL